MSLATESVPRSTSGAVLRGGLWAAQAVAAAFFCFAGYTKLITPMPQLSELMPWMAQTSEGFVRFIALVDLAGGLGLILPSLTRILPKLTSAAAVGCIVLQICAAAFHASRGEFAVLPVNAVLIALSGFILWGRASIAPVRPRG